MLSLTFCVRCQLSFQEGTVHERFRQGAELEEASDANDANEPKDVLRATAEGCNMDQ